MPVATGFFRLGGGYTAAKQTEVRAAWDGRVIHLGIHCEEPDIALIEGAGKDGGELVGVDGVEVFVRPERCRSTSSSSTRRAPGGAAGLSDGTLEWQAAASRSADAYTLEVALPLALSASQPGRERVARQLLSQHLHYPVRRRPLHDVGALAASFHEWERFALALPR